MSLHPRLCQTAAKKKVNSTLQSMAWLPRQRCAAHHKLINSPKNKKNCLSSFLFVRAVCSGRLSVVYVHPNHLVGLVVRRPPQDRKIPGSNPACAGIFSESSIPVTQKLALQSLPCQAPGVIGSALGLVGPVSVYCDWVR